MIETWPGWGINVINLICRPHECQSQTFFNHTIMKRKVYTEYMGHIIRLSTKNLINVNRVAQAATLRKPLINEIYRFKFLITMGLVELDGLHTNLRAHYIKTWIEYTLLAQVTKRKSLELTFVFLWTCLIPYFPLATSILCPSSSFLVVGMAGCHGFQTAWSGCQGLIRVNR